VDITAPNATDPSNPLVIVIRLDSSLVDGLDIGDVELFRNGTIVASGCPALNLAVGNDYPCVASATVAADDDFVFTVRAMQASSWNFGTVVPQHLLTVNKPGTGEGTVSSTDGGVDCGSDCSHSYDEGSWTTLAAAQAVGSTFTGWGGACSGTGDCVVDMSAAKTVTATFDVDAPAGTLVKSKVRLSYNKKNGLFKGVITSKRVEGKANRVVELIRRRGDDVVRVDQATTNKKGEFKFNRSFKNQSGRYHALAVESTVQKGSETLILEEEGSFTYVL
jgi:hypothetical protein